MFSKIIFTAIVLLSVNGLQAQQSLFPIKDGHVVYETIDSVKGKSKNELYVISKQWVADNFKSAQNVLQLDDKESGKLTGKFYFDDLFGERIKLNYKASFSAESKDGKTRFRIYDIIIVVGGEDHAIEERFDFQKKKGFDVDTDETWVRLNKILSGFVNGYKTYIASKAKDDF